MNESFSQQESAELLPKQESIVTFNDQFEKRNKIEVLGKPVEYIDLTPENQKTKSPVFMTPGWAETIATFKDTDEVFFNAGRRVISIEHGRLVPDTSTAILSADEKAKLEEYDLENQGDLPIPELIKAKNILAVIDAASANGEIIKVDVVAHSEGAINTLFAAALAPEKFRNIVLVGPAGITERGEDNAFKRILGGIKTYAQDIGKIITSSEEKAGVIRASNESTRYNLSSLAASVDEIGAIASTNIENLIKKLHEKGIKISIVHGQNDLMFPIKDMEKMQGREEISEFHSLEKGDHHTLYAKDEAEYVEGVLSRMGANS